MLKITSLFLSLLFITIGVAQNLEVPNLTDAYALRNCTVVIKPGEIIPRGTILVEKGLIKAVGTDIPIPAHFKTLELDSQFVYAGFISGLSQTGLKKTQSAESQEQERQNTPSPDGLSNKEMGLEPEISAVGMFDTKSKDIDELRKVGFTAMHLVPDGHMLPGQGALLLLKGDRIEQMLLSEKVSMFAQFRAAKPGRYPSTVIGNMAKLREIMTRASYALDHINMYQNNPSGIPRPEYDKATTSLFDVVSKKQVVYFHTPDILSAYRAINLYEDLGFEMIISGLKDGWDLIDKVKEKQLGVLLSLDLPREKREETSKEDTTINEPARVDPEIQRLEDRKRDAIKKYESQAGLFAAAGVNFGFSTIDVRPGSIRDHLVRMVRNGLSEDNALAAMTTHPAKMLGLSQTMGTIEEGKMANLVVTTRPYFEEKAQIRYVFVDGEKHEYDVSARRNAQAGGATVVVSGTWEYSIDVPGQRRTGTFTIEKDGNGYMGSITSAERPGESPLSNVEVNIDELSFSMSFDMGGQSLSLEYVLIIDGDSMEGNVSVGQFGVFPVVGNRISKPENRF